MFTDTIVTAGQVAGALITVGGVLSPGVWWAYKHFTNTLAILKRIEAEFRPNGGGSIRDSLVRLERDIERIYSIKRVMIDLSSAAVFETDSAGQCIWASVNYMELVERPWVDIKGDGWTIVIHQDDRDKVFAEWNKVVGRGGRFEMAYRYVTRTGQSIPVQVVAVPIPGGYYGCVTPHQPTSIVARSACLL
jgi:PAS domain-containing protein